MIRYAIRYELNGVLCWWSKAYTDEVLLAEIKTCLNKYPNATIQIYLF